MLRRPLQGDAVSSRALRAWSPSRHEPNPADRSQDTSVQSCPVIRSRLMIGNVDHHGGVLALYRTG